LPAWERAQHPDRLAYTAPTFEREKPMYLILALLAIALASGWIAQAIVGRSHGRTDWTEALVAGFLGSFVGGLLASLIAGDCLRFRPSGLIGSILGAIIVTAVWGLVRGRRTA
jgi:uncharacterized membrane protein YeaQ/YmgE (transglycosylase-associated protein family)